MLKFRVFCRLNIFYYELLEYIYLASYLIRLFVLAVLLHYN